MAGLGIDRLAPMFQVHRATVARRIQAAREAVLTETVRLLRERVGLSPSQVKSLARAVRSQVHLSLCKLLAQEDAG